MRGYGVLLLSWRIERNCGRIRVLYITPIKLTSSVAILGLTGLPSLNCSDWNEPTSEIPALGIYLIYGTHSKGIGKYVLTTISTDPYFVMAKSNSSACSSNLVTLHLTHTAALYGGKIERAMIHQESPSLPSTFLNLGYHFRRSCNVQVTDNDFCTDRERNQKQKCNRWTRNLYP